MKEAFIDWNPKKATLEQVALCAAIVDEYAALNLRLTLRQLYYQLVSRAMIPNTERSYKNLGNVLSKARLAGMIDWNAIEDRGRTPSRASEWDDLAGLVNGALRGYRLPRWKGQECYAELWVEKQALAGVLQPLAREFHVTLMVNKGYSSQSAMYESAQRIMYNAEIDDDECNEDGFLEGGLGDLGLEVGDHRPVHIFYLGDHDPSGQDMVRDVRDRLNTFMRNEVDLTVHTLALTTEQVEAHDPPPNPTKLSDSRANDYIERHGYECWEVDALDPQTLQALIREALDGVVDHELMDAVKDREKTDKKALREAVKSL